MFNTHRFFPQRYTVSKETIKISYLKNALNKPKAEPRQRKKKKKGLAFKQSFVLVELCD